MTRTIHPQPPTSLYSYVIRIMRNPSTDTVGAPLSAVLAVDDRERQPGDTRLVGGLRMSQVEPPPPFQHIPVMRDEIVYALGSVPPGVAIDATVGGGGHAAALLSDRPDMTLLGIDRDGDALDAARSRLAEFGDRVALRRARFDSIGSAAEAAIAEGGDGWIGREVTAVLFDLGVSSPQLDRPERGFSYRVAGPLDMRMDPGQGLSAHDVVNGYAEHALATLFRENGEGRYAGRIARAIIAARPVGDTAELAEIIRDAIPAPARRRGGHPAKRVFQAVRIEVNAEIDILRPSLRAAMELLAPGGRLAVLTYHSGEDRIVKAAFVDAATGGCACPPGFPCVCGADPQFRLVFRGSRTPGADERHMNPRAESARLRVIERLGAGS
ncbi:MAG: 16S rRNA (cytosine(1402)-N(4))-methyltransferase RsmH [Acidimicrobiales bacterium]